MATLKGALPYSVKLVGYVDETAEVDIKVLNDMGKCMEQRVDEARFIAMSGGASIDWFSFIPDWDEFTDELWVPDAEREYKETQQWAKDYPSFGDFSPSMAAHVTRELLERGMPHLLFKKFGQKIENNFVDSGEQDKKDPAYMTFRRYSGVQEKNNPQEEAASREDSDSTSDGMAQG